MKTLIILATLLVAPVALADILPVRQLDNFIRVTPVALYMMDKQGGEWEVKTDCQVDEVTRFETKGRAIREGTKIRVADNDYCEVISVVPSKKS